MDMSHFVPKPFICSLNAIRNYKKKSHLLTEPHNIYLEYNLYELLYPLDNCMIFVLVSYLDRNILVTNIKNSVKYLDFCAEIKDICKFDDVQPFTVKWLDEEGIYVFYHCMYNSINCFA